MSVTVDKSKWAISEGPKVLSHISFDCAKESLSAKNEGLVQLKNLNLQQIYW
jgi:hypothetical protein